MVSDKRLKHLAGLKLASEGCLDSRSDEIIEIARELQLSRLVVAAALDRDKCFICGDNQDHHPDCELGKLSPKEGEE